jgi:DHA1 family bicyclomycin/chloramphenicol resistance-like MFS transporter
MTIVGALLIAVGPLSMSLYTPAMTRLIDALHTTEGAIRGTVTIYLFGFAFAQLICGPLSDRFGRRPVLLCCLALYAIGSVLSASAGRWRRCSAAGWYRGSARAAAWRCRESW